MGNWETHGSKTTRSSDISTMFGTLPINVQVTPGAAWSDEWGLGQAIPLDRPFLKTKNITKVAQIGIIGYDQAQVSRNTSNNNIVDAFERLVPFYYMHAAGGSTISILSMIGMYSSNTKRNTGRWPPRRATPLSLASSTPSAFQNMWRGLRTRRRRSARLRGPLAQAAMRLLKDERKRKGPFRIHYRSLPHPLWHLRSPDRRHTGWG